MPANELQNLLWALESTTISLWSLWLYLKWWSCKARTFQVWLLLRWAIPSSKPSGLPQSIAIVFPLASRNYHTKTLIGDYISLWYLITSQPLLLLLKIKKNPTSQAMQKALDAPLEKAIHPCLCGEYGQVRSLCKHYSWWCSSLEEQKLLGVLISVHRLKSFPFSFPDASQPYKLCSCTMLEAHSNMKYFGIIFFFLTAFQCLMVFPSKYLPE